MSKGSCRYLFMKNKTHFKSMRSGPRHFFFLISATVLGLILLTNLIDHSRLTQPMPYSAFLKNVELGQVKSVRIVGQKIHGSLKDNKTHFETIAPENNPQQWSLLKEHGVEVAVSEPNALAAGWQWVALMGLLVMGIFAWLLLRQSRGSGGSSSTIFSMGKSRAKMISPTQVKVNFSCVAGAEEAKQALGDVIDFLKHPEKFKRLGAKLPRGILLVGEPGNGKTLLAKAVAGEANCPFFIVNGSDFVEVFVGVGAARIRDLFAQARKHAPCIIFIDEFDAISRERGKGLGGNNDEREQTLNQLLTELDGFENQNVPVVVLAATNLSDVLDKAVLRPGRFDQRIDIPYPDTKAREDILRIHARDKRISSEIDFRSIALDTAGFSGADLANLMNQAALIGSKKGHDVVTLSDIQEARIRLFRSQETHAVGASQKGAANARLFMPSQIKTTFKDVAGIKEAKEEVEDIVLFLRQPEKFKKLGARIPRGVLLVGEPGNGKTLLAKAIAGEAQCPFFSVSGSDFIEMFVGVGASRVRDLFAQVRRHSPSIVFIDEIDSIGASRTGGGYGGDQEHSRTLNQLLAEMDGFNTTGTDTIVIGATNRADILDSALLRPGRFDRQVVVPYPDLVSRHEILQVHARNVIIDESVDLHTIARGTPGFSGADLANLINEAALFASKQGHERVLQKDFDEARDKIIMGKEMRSISMSPKELKITAFHEAGHALVRLLMPDVTDPLYKVTIIPRGSSLGSTHHLPEREKYSYTREEMLASIMSALGGRIAEEIVFNTLSTGASSDFKAATDIARKMVCSYGMSENLGVMLYEPPAPYSRHESYSQETAHRIDEEIRSILKTCYDKAKELLLAHRDKLDRLAHLLLEKETLHADEIYAFLEIVPTGKVS